MFSLGRLITSVSKLVPDVFTFTLPFNSKLDIELCFSFNSVSNPLVLEIDKSPSLIVGCKSFNASCYPIFFEILKSPSLIVGCFPSTAFSTFPIFGMVKEV